MLTVYRIPFVEEAMKKYTVLCENSIMSQQPVKMVDNTSAIARLANRVLMVARQEADNSEDPVFIQSLARAADQLQGSMFSVSKIYSRAKYN